MSHIGQRIREERKSAGLSQEALAHRAGIALKSMYFLERGRTTNPHYSTLVGIAAALGLSIGELLGEPQKGNWRDLMEEE